MACSSASERASNCGSMALICFTILRKALSVLSFRLPIILVSSVLIMGTNYFWLYKAFRHWNLKKKPNPGWH
ncbi:hypothetical protein AERO8C_50389 [Aeromonas veronii]|uniref:Uncharacterized protein n=1 Tax=Aeromonas veronii TaxID=654 RepID=A0A653L9X5_AERVE|nr:hypothetical protein AERO8C_50389 [Aeromonas veronii]